MNITKDRIESIKANSELEHAHLGHANITYFKKEKGLSFAIYTLFQDCRFWTHHPKNDRDLGIQTYKILNGKVEVEYEGETHVFVEGDILDVSNHEKTFTLYAVTEVDMLITMTTDEFEPTFFETRKLQKEAEAIEEVDGYTYMHCRRIKEYSIELWKKLKLPQESFDILHWGAYFHDIGKLSIPYQILNKKTKFTDEEWTTMKSHTTVGAWMMRNHDVDRLKDAAFIVEQHHERFDGKGYPYGLKGDEISIEAAIVSVVDAFDAMTTDRIYRNALTIEEAVSEIEKGRGTQFNPIVVDAFLELLAKQNFHWR